MQRQLKKAKPEQEIDPYSTSGDKTFLLILEIPEPTSLTRQNQFCAGK
jgi:hypothetical protein